MNAVLGDTLLYAALLLAIAQTGLAAVPASRLYTKLLPAVSLTGLMVLSLAFAVLIYAYAISDFSLRVVADNSHTLKPMFYKIASSWGSHEGSILLWCWVLAFYAGLMTLWRDAHLPFNVRAYALHVMGGIQTIFLVYTIGISNPFAPLFPVPIEGEGFNPLLQDVGLAFHPPLLYLGYVGCVAPFALSVAALVSGHLGKDPDEAQRFARALHPWVVFPWTCLTAGIGLGSWWAYRELGWGGWWFWDPVENASLLPWLIITALFHANAVMKKRGNFQRWVMTLSLLAFMLSLLGTFLVRSGIITSVHSFVNDPSRGFAVLAMLTLIAGYGLYMFFRHAESLSAAKPIALFSKEMAIMANNFLLMLCMVAIVLAMLYPLLVEIATGRILTIGDEYYNAVFIALMLPALAICALSTSATWTGGSHTHLQHSTLISGFMAVASAAVFCIFKKASLLCGTGLALGLWVMFVTLVSMWKSRRNRDVLRRLLPMHLAHGALGLFTIAATLYGAMHTQSEFVMTVGQQTSAGDISLTLRDITHGHGANYIRRTGVLEVKDGHQQLTLHPEERYYPVEEQFTTEAAISSFLTYDDYATMKRMMMDNASQMQTSGALMPPDRTIIKNSAMETVVINFHRNPGMVGLWASVALMVLAGAILLFNYVRHYRII